jgi:hypothetical protein
LALQTDKLNVLGGGAIKLETEEIELRFKTVKRTGVGLSLLGVADSFVIVDGTLKHPRAKGASTRAIYSSTAPPPGPPAA